MQIDVPETLDIADRATFYDATGAALDMLVTHLFQVAAEVAMEPPTTLGAADLQFARESVISAFRPLDPDEVVLGQFQTYTQTDGVADDSTTDTFVAARLWVDTDRWRDVPFLLRTGKRLAISAERVSLVYRHAEGPLHSTGAHPGVLSFDLSGKGAIELAMTVKRPGPDLIPDEIDHVLRLDAVSPDGLDPYTSLLHDVFVGRPIAVHQLGRVAGGVHRLRAAAERPAADGDPVRRRQLGSERGRGAGRTAGLGARAGRRRARGRSGRRVLIDRLIQQAPDGGRSDGPERVQGDRVQLRLFDGEQMDTEPAAVTDVRWPEEALRLGLHHLLLDPVRCSAPDGQPAVVVMVVEEHHEALLVPDEERRTTVARPFRRLRQSQTGGADHRQAAVDVGVGVGGGHALAPFDRLRARAVAPQPNSPRVIGLPTVGPFDQLILDAALTTSPVPDPVAVLRAFRALPRPAAGPLLVPDHSLAAVGRVAGDDPVEVCVLNTGGAGGLLALAARSVAGVFVVGAVSPLRDLDDLAGNASRVVSAARELSDQITVYVEIPYAPGWVGAVEQIEAAGLSGAIRLAGDGPGRTVELLSGMIEADLPFLVADGAGGALSNGSSPGLVSLMLAIEALIDGAEPDEAAELLALDDPDRARVAVEQWDEAALGRIRRRLLGVASRTPDQLLEELDALGLVSRG